MEMSKALERAQQTFHRVTWNEIAFQDEINLHLA